MTVLRGICKYRKYDFIFLIQGQGYRSIRALWVCSNGLVTTKLYMTILRGICKYRKYDFIFLIQGQGYRYIRASRVCSNGLVTTKLYMTVLRGICKNRNYNFIIFSIKSICQYCGSFQQFGNHKVVHECSQGNQL